MPDLIHSLALGDVLRNNERAYRDRTAVICGDHRLSYAELGRRVERLAAALGERGVSHGERVLWIGFNCHRVLELLLASACRGAILCPVNWRQTPSELAATIHDLDPAVVVWESSFSDSLDRSKRAGSRAWISADGLRGDLYERLVAKASSLPADPQVDPATGVLAVYTAAFGGRLNAAVISHNAIILQSLVIAMLAAVRDDYIYLNCGPMFHVGTLMMTAATFLMGGTNVFIPRAEPEAICAAIDRERCTGALIVEPTLSAIVELNRHGRYDLRSLRSPSATAEWDAMVTVDDTPWGRRFGGYGQTESFAMLTVAGLGGTGVHGRPSPVTQLRILREDSREAEIGEVGEIAVRGPTVMIEYHARKAENAARFRSGWYWTNDLGRREPDGSITFIGSKGRLIKSGMENIYPQEVENCLASHPDIGAAAVIGVPDPIWSQRVVAIVVPRPGHELTVDAVVDHCLHHLASYKRPRTVIVTESLPRKGPTVDYEELDRRYGGGGYPGQGSR